jgi:hypothetical protein
MNFRLVSNHLVETVLSAAVPLYAAPGPTSLVYLSILHAAQAPTAVVPLYRPSPINNTLSFENLVQNIRGIFKGFPHIKILSLSAKKKKKM